MFNIVTRPRILIALAFAALLVLSALAVQMVADGIGLAHGDVVADAVVEDAGAARPAAAANPADPMATLIADTPAPIGPVLAAPPPPPPPPPPAATPDLVERLARSGKLASAVQVLLHLVLNFGLARWAWLCQLAPWLGRWKWAAIASAAAAALTVTLPAAATGSQTWEMLLWPLGVAIAQVILPSNNPAGPRKLPAAATA